MMNHFIRPAIFLPLVASSLVVLTSCRMFTPPSTSTMLSQGEIAAMVKRGKAPQVYGLTAYRTENGVLFAGAFRLHAGQIGRTDFKSDRNSTAPIISVNDGDLLMLIDSSAAESWCSPEARAGMKGVVLKDPNIFQKSPRHVYETVPGFAVVAPTMTIDKMNVESAVFYMRAASGSLNMLNRWEKSPTINGVLGADFLRAFQFVRISLRDRYIVLSATAAYPATASTLAAVPTRDLEGGIGVDAMLEGEKTAVMIDLAGDFELALPQPAGPTMRQVSIGDVVFRQTEVVSGFELGLGTNSTPRIGRQLLEKYDLVLNNFGKQLIIELPAK